MSTWRHVKIVASGSNFKVYVDGNLEINYSDATYTSGYFGFDVFGVSARYDNFTINNNTEVYYVRDVTGDVLGEYDFADNLVAEYVYGNGQRIAKRNLAGNVDVYLNDHLGSARAMVGNGWSANYYPFGEVASQTGTNADTRFDFTGQPPTATAEVAQDATIASTAVIAPAADKASTTLVTLSPMGGPEGAPLMLGAATGLKIISFTAKGINLAVGGNNFSGQDLVGDVSNLILSLFGMGGAISGEVIDQLIDNEIILVPDDKKDEEEN